MTPDQIAKSGSEHGHQAALFAYCAVARLHGWGIADEWARGEIKLEMPRGPHSPTPKPVPALEWFHAIHNQGHGDKVRGANAKAEGVRKGIADTFLPWPVWTSESVNVEIEGTAGFEIGEMVSKRAEVRRIKWCGLYIEMKKPSEKPKSETAKGGVSEDQAKFGMYCNSNSYGWIVCYSWREAADNLRRYIEWGK